PGTPLSLPLISYTTLFRSRPERDERRLVGAAQQPPEPDPAAAAQPADDRGRRDRGARPDRGVGGDPRDRPHRRRRPARAALAGLDRKSTRLNSSHVKISYA